MHRFRYAAVLSFVTAATAFAADSRPNVLFIPVDDLRPELGCYGHSRMHTPNIDRLAKRSVIFERAYCMVPVCGASRASLMTGIRPTRDRFVGYQASAEKEAPGITTLNTHFKNHGYHTISNGKVFHVRDDSDQGWSEPAWRPSNGAHSVGPAWTSDDVPDEAYRDGQIAEKAIDDLRRLAKQDQPFFLAVGFIKPHLPFEAPRKYWDLYDAKTIKLPDTYHRPENAPDQAIHDWGELRKYDGIPKRGPLTDEQAKKMIHGYYACVSYVDAQIGKVLDELDRLGLADNTIVVLWGDHGWNLGEHTLWCKHACFETSMRTPLIVSAPGIPGNQKATGLVEFIDIYPTLCELAGLSVPGHLEGVSIVPLLKQPDRAGKEFAIGRYRNGDTIRTDQYRYSEYTNRNGRVTGQMLYDHQTDPEEDRNISERPDSRRVAKQLSTTINKHRGRARPSKQSLSRDAP